MTINELGDVLKNIDTKLDILISREFPVLPQQEISKYFQEVQLITRLKMDGYSHEEAIKYVDRIYNGERPWREENK